MLVVMSKIDKIGKKRKEKQKKQIAKKKIENIKVLHLEPQNMYTYQKDRVITNYSQITDLIE